MGLQQSRAKRGHRPARDGVGEQRPCLLLLVATAPTAIYAQLNNTVENRTATLKSCVHMTGVNSFERLVLS
jgi:hypothetical protein